MRKLHFHLVKDQNGIQVIERGPVSALFFLLLYSKNKDTKSSGFAQTKYEEEFQPTSLKTSQTR